MDTETIHAVVAKAENGMVKILLVIDNRPREFMVARHVAAAIIKELAGALVKE